MTDASARRPAAPAVFPLLGTLLLATAFLAAGCAAQWQPAGPETVTASIGSSHFVMPDGYRLPFNTYLPEGEPAAVAVALHGFNDHKGAWAEPATRWAKGGVAVYAYDQRGFGETTRRGIWPGVETLQADLRRVVELVQARHPGLPVLLVGESMGGAVVMAALGEGAIPGVDGAVLAAPAVWSRKTMPWLYDAMLDLVVGIAPGMSATGQGLGIRASDNTPMLRALGRDPLFIRSTRFDTLSGLVDLMDAAYEAAPKIDLPLLVLYGQRDQIVPAGAIRRTIERLTCPYHLAIYQDGWHLLFRDLQGPIVQHDVLKWMLDAEAPLPSGADIDAADRLTNGRRATG